MKYTNIFRTLLLSIGVLVTLMNAAPVAAADVTCSILPQSICDAATSQPGKGGDVSNTGVFMLLVWGINILTAGVGLVAVGVLVYAGIMYSSAGGSNEQVSKAKGMITNVVIGLVAYGLMYFALNWLIPGGVIG